MSLWDETAILYDEYAFLYYIAYINLILFIPN